MPDREKVIMALEKEIATAEAIETIAGGFVYITNGVARDALELLKEQEPQVLTLEEVLGGDECWFEYINGSCGYADVYMQDNKTAIIYRTNIRPGEVPITDYMKKWRCWSYRPTEEQRKAVKWRESDDSN